MDKKKSLLNISISIFFKFLIMILALVSRKVIISCLGNELNGLSALYSSIIGVLCVVELGIGSAITFSMYKPIVEKDLKKVNALYILYKKLYTIVGIIIFLFGLLLIPFLHLIAKGYTVLPKELYFGYVFYLISTVLVYFFSSKISLINAHKNNYVTSFITSSCQILLYLIQIVVLFIFKSFIIFNFVRLITVGINFLLIELYIKKKHKNIFIENGTLGDLEKKSIKKNVGAMFFHKIGAELVNTSDNIIISTFLGVIILGYYSNYATLIISLQSLLNLVFISLTSIIGHLYVKNGGEKSEKYFRFFHSINFIIGIVFYLGYYSIIDQFIYIFYDNTGELLLGREIVFIITLSYFVQYMRKATLMFRDATGTFYNDRFLPLIEGVINIILSIVLLKWLGLFGVILATIITNITINYIFEPMILYKNAFDKNSLKFIIKNYVYFVLFSIILLVFDKINIVNQNYTIGNLILNGLFSILISSIVITIVIIFDSNLREMIFKKKGK